MKLTPVKSSQLVALGYNPETQVLVAEFQGRKFYRYANVPEDSYFQVMEAESKGSAFNQLVKRPGYAYQEISRLEAEALQ